MDWVWEGDGIKEHPSHNDSLGVEERGFDVASVQRDTLLGEQPFAHGMRESFVLRLSEGVLFRVLCPFFDKFAAFLWDRGLPGCFEVGQDIKEMDCR